MSALLETIVCGCSHTDPDGRMVCRHCGGRCARVVALPAPLPTPCAARSCVDVTTLAVPTEDQHAQWSSDGAARWCPKCHEWRGRDDLLAVNTQGRRTTYRCPNCWTIYRASWERTHREHINARARERYAHAHARGTGGYWND